MSTQEEIDKLVRVFIKMRDKRSELAREAKEKEDELEAKMDKVRKALLNYCKDNGLEYVRTESGTFFRSIKTSYTTSDWTSMHKFMIENKALDLVDKRLNQTNMKQFLEENPELLPPGLNVEREYAVTVRRKK